MAQEAPPRRLKAAGAVGDKEGKFKTKYDEEGNLVVGHLGKLTMPGEATGKWNVHQLGAAVARGTELELQGITKDSYPMPLQAGDLKLQREQRRLGQLIGRRDPLGGAQTRAYRRALSEKPFISEELQDAEMQRLVSDFDEYIAPRLSLTGAGQGRLFGSRLTTERSKSLLDAQERLMQTQLARNLQARIGARQGALQALDLAQSRYNPTIQRLQAVNMARGPQLGEQEALHPLNTPGIERAMQFANIDMYGGGGYSGGGGGGGFSPGAAIGGGLGAAGAASYLGMSNPWVLGAGLAGGIFGGLGS